MRLGFGLPHIGPAASPEALIAVAQRAEALGYESVWVTERLLYPLEPKTPRTPVRQTGCCRTITRSCSIR